MYATDGVASGLMEQILVDGTTIGKKADGTLYAINTGNVRSIIMGSTTYTPNDSGAVTLPEKVTWANIEGKPSTFTPSAHTHSYLPLAGGTLTGALVIQETTSAASYAMSGGAFHAGYANIILRGNSSTGVSGIVFTSSKGTTNINQTSDRGFIQFHAYGVAPAAEGTDPTLSTSGEINRLVIGVGNDGDDMVYIQTPASTGLRHLVGTSAHVILDSGNFGDYAAAKSHTHAISQITNLQATLDGKAAASHTHSYLPLSGGKLTGSLEINSTGGSWNEGIRMHTAPNGWCGVIMCGSDNTGSSGTSANTWGIHNNDGNFYINRNASNGASAYILCNVNGNWGMGTNSPNYKLHVNGTLGVTGAITTSEDVSIKNTTAVQNQFKVINNLSELWMGVNQVGESFLWTPSNTCLILGTNNRHRLDILANGNVGIGTTSPSYKLHVNGTLGVEGSVTATSFVGNASSATKLTSSAGSATLPIYFSDGKPVACTASSVFSNLSNSGNNISVTVAGQNRTLTVGYASNADKVDGYHASNIMQAGWIGLYRTGGSASTIKWTRIGRFITTANDNPNNDAMIEFFSNGDQNYTYFGHGRLMLSSYSTGSSNMMLTSVSDGSIHFYATIDANRYIWLGHNAWWTGSSKYRVLFTGSFVEWYSSSLTMQTTNPNDNYITDNGTFKYNAAMSTASSGSSHSWVWQYNSRVAYATSAGNSDTCDGLHVHGGRNNEANKIVRTDGSGYLQVGYINSSNGDEGNNSSPARVWGTNGSDSYMRTYLTSALSVKYAASAGNADTLDGNHASAFATAGHNHFSRHDTVNIDTGLSHNNNWHYEISNATGTLPFRATWRQVYVMGGNDTNFTVQISTGLTDNNPLYFRHRRSGSWDAWRTILDNNNYKEYAPTKTGTGASGTWEISVSGNAATATTASKLGTANVGSGTQHFYLNGGTATASTSNVGGTAKPMYLNAGVMTAISATVGGTAKPIFLNAGTLTAISDTVGGTAKPIYLNGGTLTAISTTAGSTTLPVYLNAGTITACGTSLGVSITGNAATASAVKDLTNSRTTYLNYATDSVMSPSWLCAWNTRSDNTYEIRAISPANMLTVIKALPLAGGTLTGSLEITSGQLLISSGSDNKIVINNTDNDTYWSNIDFRQKNTSYGILGTRGSKTLQWTGGDFLVTGGITMYSDLRKKNILSDEVLSVKEIAAAPLFKHTYKSDDNQYIHVGTSAQYWSGIHEDWFTRKDSEGYYQMELQNLGVAMGISLAREIVKYESKTDKKIKLMKKKINELEARVKELEERRTA